MGKPAFFSTILKKWHVFFIAGIIAGLIGVGYAWISPPQYQSRLTFALDAGNNDVGGLSGAINLAAQFGLGLGSEGNMFMGDNIIEIIKSRRIVEKVLLTAENFDGKDATLADYYLDITGLRAKYDSKERTKNIHFAPGSNKNGYTYLQDSLLNVLYLKMVNDNITASRPDKKLILYELKIVSPNEKFSKVFTDRLIQEAAAFYTEITSQKDKETVDLLEQRVDSMKRNVGNSILSRAISKDANINPAFAIAQTNPSIQEYNMTAYSEAYKELFKNLELAKYQYLKKIPLLQIVDHADYPMEKIKLSKALSFIIGFITAVFLLLIYLYLRNQSKS